MLKRYDSSWTMRAMVLIGLTFILEACGGGSRLGCVSTSLRLTLT